MGRGAAVRWGLGGGDGSLPKPTVIFVTASRFGLSSWLTSKTHGGDDVVAAGRRPGIEGRCPQTVDETSASAMMQRTVLIVPPQGSRVLRNPNVNPPLRLLEPALGRSLGFRRDAAVRSGQGIGRSNDRRVLRGRARSVARG